MTMRRLLDYQADQIEMVLYAHKIAGQVRGGTVTPRWVRFNIALAATATPEKVARLQGAIGHRLGAECRVQIRGGELVVEVARAGREDVTLSQVVGRLAEAPPLAALLGVGLTDGRPLLLRLPSPDVAHVLVSGTTGCGKTELMRSIIVSLAWYNEAGIQLYVIDPTGLRYNDLAWLPHLPLRGITTDLDDTADVIGMLVAELETRQEPEPRIIIVIDELADLGMVGGQPILDGITRLTQRGRGAGIHVLAGTQKPTADAIGGLVKSNFPTRIVGRVMSAEDAKVASGLPGTGAETLLGRGDFLLVLGGLTRFQAALCDPDCVHQLRGRIRRGGYAGAFEGDPLAEYREHVKGTLRVLPGGRQDEQEARRIISLPGWVDQWWDGEALAYGHQTAIGEIVGEQNAGSGHRRITRLTRAITEILTSSTTSSTSAGDS
jgi:S-DNA-T family DNA segregation ATPase FtsK/SpoIIIE